MKKTWLQKQWESIPETWRIELWSISQTFISAVIVQVAMDFPKDGQDFNGDILQSIAFAALRSGLKSVFAVLLTRVKKTTS